METNKIIILSQLETNVKRFCQDNLLPQNKVICINYINYNQTLKGIRNLPFVVALNQSPLPKELQALLTSGEHFEISPHQITFYLQDYRSMDAVELLYSLFLIIDPVYFPVWRNRLPNFPKMAVISIINRYFLLNNILINEQIYKQLFLRHKKDWRKWLVANKLLSYDAK